MPWECSAYKFTMASPEDVSGLESLIAQGSLSADEVSYASLPKPRATGV